MASQRDTENAPCFESILNRGKKRNNISYLKNKYKEISQMLGESKIKKKKMLGGRLGLGRGEPKSLTEN